MWEVYEMLKNSVFDVDRIKTLAASEIKEGLIEYAMSIKNGGKAK